MPLTAAVTQHWSDGKRIHVIGILTPSGDYTNNGDIIDFGLQAIKSSKPPIWVEVQLAAIADGAVISPATFIFLTGTTINNGKLVIYTGVSQLAGAYAGQIATPLKFYAIFHQFV